MTTEINLLGRLRLANETVFNTSGSCLPATGLDIPIVEKTAVFAGLQDHLEPEVMQQYVHGFDNSKLALGKRSNTLNFTTYLAGTGNPRTGITAAAGGSLMAWNEPSGSAADDSIGMILSTLMGSSSHGTTLQSAATWVNGTSATTYVSMSTSHAAALAVKGGAYAVVMPSGVVEAREILAVAGNVVYPTMAHSAVPTSGSAVYWGTTYHLIEGTGTSNLGTLQAFTEGVESPDGYVANGLQGNFSIDVAPGTIAKLAVTLQGGAWVRATAGLTAPLAITNFMPIVNTQSELLVGPVFEVDKAWTRTTTTATVTNVAHGLSIGDVIWVTKSSDTAAITGSPALRVAKTVLTVPTADTFTFAALNAGLTTGTLTYTGCQRRNKVSPGVATWQPGFAVTPIPDSNGVGSSGISGYKRTRGRAITGTFQAYDDTGINWQTYDANKTDIAVYQQIGMTTAGCVLISAPTTQISLVPSRADMGGLQSQLITWVGRNSDSGVLPANDLQRSALKITRF